MTENARPITPPDREPEPAPVTEYFVPVDPMEDLQCDSCQ